MKKKSVILFDPKAPTGKSKRPNHPDFMTSSELAKIEFTGVRPNPLSNQWEFWILGKTETAGKETFVEKLRDDSPFMHMMGSRDGE